MGLTATFSEPFYHGGSGIGADIVPGQYPVAIGGHPYLVDWKSDEFRHQPIPLLRSQQDIQDEVGESSLNPEGWWLRSTGSWHHGAGQDYLDEDDSDPARFRESKGIDVWTRREMSLLQATLKKRTSANTNLGMVVVGSRLYVIDGSTIAYTTDVVAGSPTFTAVTGGPATAPTSIASDGKYVITSHGADGIYLTNSGTGATTSYVTGTVELVAYAMGRIMAASGPSIYNVTTAYSGGPAVLPTVLFTHPNDGFAWVGFASGNTHMYAAGFSGDKSQIYKIRVKDDGTGLDVPSLAHPGLPDGEIVRAIGSYLGFILIGTDKGWRFATADSAGNLTIGPLVETNSAVRCFEGQGKNIWFGWTNYDSTSSGLGRMDPTILVDTLTPAYASDLMATAQGSVLSVATFQNVRVFAVSGDGFWIEDTAHKVATGRLDSGWITYRLSDAKIAMFLDVRYRTLVGTHRVSIAGPDGVFTSLGSRSASSSSEPFTLGQRRAEMFEIRHELDRDSTNTNTAPILTRSTLKVNVTTNMGEYIFCPVLLSETDDVGGIEKTRDPRAELAYLKGLRRDRTLVAYQEGLDSYAITVEGVLWMPHHDQQGFFPGTALVQMKHLAS